MTLDSPPAEPPETGERGAVPGAATAGAADDDELERLLEAVLVTSEGPLPSPALAAALDRDEATVKAALDSLARWLERERRGQRLRETASGWRLFAAPEYAEIVRRVVTESQPARLSRAALETLAVVAYQQPVSRSRIAAIRGVNVDAVVRTLLGRGLIVEAGQDDHTGATLYATTPLFLDKIGVTSLDQLPPLAPLLPDRESLAAIIDEVST